MGLKFANPNRNQMHVTDSERSLQVLRTQKSVHWGKPGDLTKNDEERGIKEKYENATHDIELTMNMFKEMMDPKEYSAWMKKLSFIRRDPDYSLKYQHELSRIMATVSAEVCEKVFGVFKECLQAYKSFFEVIAM